MKPINRAASVVRRGASQLLQGKSRARKFGMRKRTTLPQTACDGQFGLAMKRCRLELEWLDRRVEPVDPVHADDEELGRLAGALEAIASAAWDSEPGEVTKRVVLATVPASGVGACAGVDSNCRADSVRADTHGDDRPVLPVVDWEAIPLITEPGGDDASGAPSRGVPRSANVGRTVAHSLARTGRGTDRARRPGCGWRRGDGAHHING